MDTKELATLSTAELETRLMEETDVSEMEQIINMFNINSKKKDIVRVNRLNDLQDKISNQMMERVEKKAGEFSNKDLLDYFKVIQDTIRSSDSTLESVKPAAIQINQQNINITEDSLSRESRDKITNAINSILAKAQKPSVIDTNYEIIEEDNERGIESDELLGNL